MGHKNNCDLQNNSHHKDNSVTWTISHRNGHTTSKEKKRNGGPIITHTKSVVDQDYIANVALKPLNITQLIVRPQKSTHKFPSMSLATVTNLIKGLSWTVVIPLPTIMELQADGFASNTTLLGEATKLQSPLLLATYALDSHQHTQSTTLCDNYLSSLTIHSELFNFNCLSFKVHTLLLPLLHTKCSLSSLPLGSTSSP